jgi:hypothetical protein
MKKRNAGFGVVGTTLVVTVVAVVGFVLWRVYGVPDSKQNSPASASTSEGTTIDANAGYVVIKEWGVRFKPTDGLVAVRYFMVAGAEDRTVSFTTDELSQIEPSCGVASGKIVLGGLMRTTTPSNSLGKLHGPINGYYYYSKGPQAPCASAEHEQLEGKTLGLVLLSLESLEPAK